MAVDDVAMAMPESVPMGGGSDAPTASNAVVAPADDGSKSMEAGVDFSGTNVQELGIDGRPTSSRPTATGSSSSRTSGCTTSTSRAGPPSSPTRSNWPATWGSEMLLDGDRLLVLAQTGGRGGEREEVPIP